MLPSPYHYHTHYYKFAFTFNEQQVTFTRVPQGYHNAPSICHQIVAALWKASAYHDNIVSYVNDILIATKTKLNNITALDEVLGILKTVGLLVNPTKAQLVKQAIYQVQLGPAGRKPDASQVELTSKLPAPTDVGTLRSLSLVGFSRDFIEGYSEKARPLYQLLRKDQLWKRGGEQQKAVQQLKKTLTEAPSLAFPQVDKPFHLQLALIAMLVVAILL
ncbi:unnamed protein product [Caretta caretta]